MDNVIYYYLNDLDQKKIDSLDDFFIKITYLFSMRVIPPRSIVNEILEHGVVDHGMGGGFKWNPFSVSEETYRSLVVNSEKRGVRYIEPPLWVANYSDWYVWMMEYTMGIPAKEHKELNDEVKRLEDAAKKAFDVNNKELGYKLHLEAVDAGNKLADFIQSYMK